jgi:hypothetical protein
LRLGDTQGSRLKAHSSTRSVATLRVVNASGYSTSDLRRFFLRGLRAMRVPESRTRQLRVVVTPAPQRSRGCADVGGHRISIAIAAPWRFSLRRLARLWEHEVAHAMGWDHKEMSERLLYSLGRTSGWAEGSVIRYMARARSVL